MKPARVVCGGLLIAVAPLIVLAATVYTLMLPNLYRSSARISVTGDAPQVNPFTEGEAVAPYNPYFLRTQFEVIQSTPILYQVISRLNLQQVWGRDGDKLPRSVALKILRNSVQVSQMRDTSLIVISVTRDNPDEAADIANELAETYRDARLDAVLHDERNAIDNIGEVLKEQSQRVEEAEAKVQQLASELQIPAEADAMALQSEKYRPYRAAKADLETEQFIRDQLKMKHREKIISLEVPRHPVEIIDIAEPNRRPVSPNLFMNVLLSVAVAGLCGLSGGLMVATGVRK